MSPTDGFGIRFREAEMQDFTCLDEIFDRASHIFDRYLRIYPVLVIEIDAVGSKALE